MLIILIAEIGFAGSVGLMFKTLEEEVSVTMAMKQRKKKFEDLFDLTRSL